ncbi:MAG: PDZ domain-containing protein [Reichenbachiella sp.]
MKFRMRKIGLISLLIFISITTSFGQTIGFSLMDGKTKSKIEFEYYNNLIIIPVTINGGIQIKFILDTGVQYPILTEKYLGDVLEFEYDRRVVVHAPGVNDSLSALVTNNIHLSLADGTHSGMNQSLVVLEKDYLMLREHLGIEVYGIIGYDIFSRFIVKINYEEKYIELYEPKKFRQKRNYKKLPMTISNTKPYIDVTVNKGKQDEKIMKLMVDTGAGHSLLLNNPEFNSILPEKNIPSVIGRGIGGEIYGHLGRLSTISVNQFDLEQPIVSFPLKGDYGSLAKRGSHNGTVGGEFLSRFNVVFDYFSGNLYLKKNKYYTRDFEYDMSGMTIVAHGGDFDRFKVTSVRYESPAYDAGIRSGDIIMTINGYDYETLKLSGANALLRNKPGKKITVKIKDGDSSIKKSFKLERYI